MTKKFKIGDKVKITSGKHQGKISKITKLLPAKHQVMVEGVNLYKKHLKPRATGGQGQIIDRQRPISLANISLICPHCKKPTRVSKKRLCTKCQKPMAINKSQSRSAGTSKKK